MTIHFVKGDLLAIPLESGTALVNPVNCVGVMGKGLALQFKQKYPGMMPGYIEACMTHRLRPGTLLWQPHCGGYICQFPTKDDWRNPSQLEWVEWGLQTFIASASKRGITRAIFPPLGCGNGGLHWEQVKPLMVRYLHIVNIEIYIFTP